jgi:hypothetical protein
MKTDWTVIRAMMNAAIDTCEQIEALGYAEADRGNTVDVNGYAVSVQDFITSAWTYPENLRYRIIRERHEQGADLPYVQEASRTLSAMAQACGELIGAADHAPAAAAIDDMIRWYGTHVLPNLARAIPAKP